METRGSVTYVVPTFNRPDAVALTLEHLSALEFPADRLEVIVVDDGSPPSSAAAVEQAVRRMPNARHAFQENAGVATARNHGARLARGETLIFLDDDILVEPSNARDHLALLEGSERSLVAAGTVRLAPAPRAVLESTPFGRFRLEFEERSISLTTAASDGGTWKADAAGAANFSIARASFNALGGFDEAFPYAGAEDREFTYRAHRAGYTIVLDPAIRVLHNDSHVDLDSYLRRQQRNAITWVFFAARHPEESYGEARVAENAPIAASDSLGLKAKKVAKSALSARPVLGMLERLVRRIERVWPYDALLDRAYRLLEGLYLFRGVRAGFAAVSERGVATMSESPSPTLSRT
jgi:GT2 family glycosyltransferase